MRDGLGLFAGVGAHSAMRAVIPTVEPTVLLSLKQTTLSVSIAGLSLQVPESDSDLCPLTGWRITGNAVQALSDTTTVDLSGRDVGTLLRIAGRQATHIDVRRAPLHDLLAPLLVFLREATTVAGSTGAHLCLQSSPV